MNPATYHITTLGCRVNFAETRELETILWQHGLARADDRSMADLEIIHTCSVTNSAVRKSRHAIRRARKGSKTVTNQPQVLVTGCFATTDLPAAEQLTSRENIFPHESADDHRPMLERFDQRIAELTKPDQQSLHQPSIRNRAVDSSAKKTVLSLPITPIRNSQRNDISQHIRAELKIQDGCDAHCTFCIIPKIRRTLRSKTIRDAVTEATQLIERGHKEIVLTGIFIGAYGHETALRRKQTDAEREHLAELIDAVAQVPGLQRLRLSSMEPIDATDALLDAMVANQPVVVPHLHLPLQSGSNRILKKMNRQYCVEQYLKMIDRVNEALTPDSLHPVTPSSAAPLPPAITTDIICGFPGETEDDFQATLDVANRVQYLHMHVFPYSPRPGTAAARWTDDHIDHATKKQRVRTLIDLEEDPADGFSIRYRQKLIGRTLRVVVEHSDDNIITGRCDHYAQIHIDSSHSKQTPQRGDIFQVQITDVTPDQTIGTLSQKLSLRLPVLQE